MVSSKLAMLFGVVSVCVLGCGGDSPTTPSPTTRVRTPQSLAISGTTTFEAVNLTSRLTAMLAYSDGSSEDVSGRSTWRTSDATVVTVSGTGLLTTVGFGQAEVTATFESLPASTSVSVISGGFSVTPESRSVAQTGGEHSFTVATTSPNAPWTATSDGDSWLVVIEGHSGTGEGTVTYRVEDNVLDVRRNGTITVAGSNGLNSTAVHFVTQSPAQCHAGPEESC